MTAFDPTPLRPDAPALPSIEPNYGIHESPTYHSGLTARQHAAIALCVPDSGCDWLDAMIERRQHDEFMKSALNSDSADSWSTAAREEDIADRVVLYWRIANAMIAASKKEPA